MATLHLAESVDYGTAFGIDTTWEDVKCSTFEEAMEQGIKFLGTNEGIYCFAANGGAYQSDPYQEHSDRWFSIE